MNTKSLLSSPIFGYFGFVIISMWVLLETTGGLNNGDTFFHIRVGGEILSGNWKPWNMGHFNDMDHAEWVSTQWLSQVTLAFIVKMWGVKTLAYLWPVVTILLLFSIYFILSKYSFPVFGLVLTALFFFTQSGWMSLRPQLFSYFFILLLTHVWMKAFRDKTIPWVTIPIMFIWPQLHGMWIAGLLNIFVLTFAWSLDKRFKGVQKLWLVAVLSFIATLLNPSGIKLLLGAVSLSSRATGGTWSEWAAPTYTDLAGATSFMVLAFAVLLFAKGKSHSWFTSAVLLLALMWGLWSLRSMPLSFLMFSLLIVYLLEEEYGLVATTVNSRHKWGQLLVTGVVSTVILSLLTIPTYSNRVAPEWFRDSLNEIPKGEVILTTPGIGNFALYARPDVNVFIHGYLDSLTEGEAQRNADIINLREDWDKKLVKTGATIAYLEEGSQITYALEDKGWTTTNRKMGIVRMIPPIGPPELLTEE